MTKIQTNKKERTNRGKINKWLEEKKKQLKNNEQKRNNKLEKRKWTK